MVAPIVLAAKLAPLAPTILRWLGGDKAGQAADKVLDIARAVSGQDSPDAAVQAIHDDPALALEFQRGLWERETELDRMLLADRQHARQTNADSGAHLRAFWFGVFLVTLALGAEAAVMFAGLPPDADPQIIGRILGTLDAAALAVIYYVFGSSAGSAQKNDWVKR
jgi:hypothetical protein